MKTSKSTKPSADIKQTNKLETVKTVLIAMLVTGILAFVGGIKYANSQNAKVEAVRQSVTSQPTAVAPVEPTQGK